MLERIERIEREKERAKRQKTEEEQRKKVAEEKLNKERERKSIREVEEYRRSRGQANEMILRESGILPELTEFQRSRLAGTTRKHNLIVNNASGEVILVWGSRYTIHEDRYTGDDRIDYEKPFLGRGNGVKDYSCINVGIDGQERQITIRGNSCIAILSEHDWRNRELVLDRLVEAYLNPLRVNESEARRAADRRWAASNVSTECCNQ